jgi:hypothetical protein
MSYIHAILFNRKGKKLSDIEFLAIKEFGSKLRKHTAGKVSTNTDVATLTANTGKDMYLASAKVSIEGTLVTGTSLCDVELLVNGTIVETALYIRNYSTQAGYAVNSWEYEFKNIGHKVAAGQIIKLQTTGIQSCNVVGYVECFEEDTGASPASW